MIWAEYPLTGGIDIADANAIGALILAGLAPLILCIGVTSGGAGIFLVIRHPGRCAEGTTTLGLVLNAAVTLMSLVGLVVAGFFTL